MYATGYLYNLYTKNIIVPLFIVLHYKRGDIIHNTGESFLNFKYSIKVQIIIN